MVKTIPSRLNWRKYHFSSHCVPTEIWYNEIDLSLRFIRSLDIGVGNNPMVGMTVSTAVSIEEAAKAGKF